MKTKIFIFEDKRNDYNFLKEELAKHGEYEVISQDGLLNAIAEGTTPKYVENVLKDNWNKGLKLIVFDLLVDDAKKKTENLGADLIQRIREDKDFIIDECPPFSMLIPIIVVTGTAEQSDIDTARDAGANFYIPKPIKNPENDRQKKESKEIIEQLKAKTRELIFNFEKKLSYISVVPSHILNEVAEFKEKYQGRKTAFIMTSFKEEHKKIADEIKIILNKHGITGLLADAEGGENKNDVWPNIEVFMHGCDFGIGIYADDSVLGISKRMKKGDNNKIRINSNLSLEVGYMLGLKKQICFLKEENLDKLNSDLASKIYVNFNDSNLENKLTEWLKNKKIID